MWGAMHTTRPRGQRKKRRVLSVRDLIHVCVNGSTTALTSRPHTCPGRQ